MSAKSKYRFTGATCIIDGRTLQRIERLGDGVIGGFIESEANLSQSGSCFLHGDSVAYGNARISDDAQVYGQAYGDAKVSGLATIRGSVFDRAEVSGRAIVQGRVYEDAKVMDAAVVRGSVFGSASVSGDCLLYTSPSPRD